MKATVSVIVPNHGRDLTKLLESLKNSSVKVDDLIVVDIGKERSLQRNLGISRAKSDYLLFLDSDQSISPCLIKECLKLMEEGFSALYIPEIIVAKSFFGRIRAFERTFYDGTAVDVPRFVRKAICPRFDEEQFGTEDSDWGNRISGFKTITRNPLYHHDDISILTYFRKKNFYAKSLKRFRKRNPTDKILNPYYRVIGVYIEKGKWRKILEHPFLFFGIMCIVFIRGIIYLWNMVDKPKWLC